MIGFVLGIGQEVMWMERLTTRRTFLDTVYPEAAHADTLQVCLVGSRGAGHGFGSCAELAETWRPGRQEVCMHSVKPVRSVDRLLKDPTKCVDNHEALSSDTWGRCCRLNQKHISSSPTRCWHACPVMRGAHRVLHAASDDIPQGASRSAQRCGCQDVT